MIRRRILLVALLAILFAIGWWAGRGRATTSLYSNLDLFVEVIHKVEENYVDPVEPKHLIDGALKGMLKGLDPYSQYLDQKAYGALQDVTQGKFSGIGVVVGVRDNYPTVISPIEGSPAWEAGLRSGDAIVRVEGRSTQGFTIEDVAGLLRGPEGSRVRLSVRREGDGEERDFTLTRREIATPSVPYAFMEDDQVGYVRVASFSEKTGAELRAALARLRAAGARRLVLDMRRNPGGLLDQAVDVAEQFLPRGALLVSTRGRARAQESKFFASEPRPETHWPMVVLVDEGSASAAEIVAGALQDLDRALLMGRTTFGKGSVQSVFPLRGREAALKLTTALYYTPSGRSIHRVRADSLEQADDDDSDDDSAPEHHPAPADSARQPAFHTRGGRIVYGGGGIRPDVVVADDSLPPLTQRIEQRGLPMRFASRWAASHPASRAVLRTLPVPVWEGFLAYARAESVSIDGERVRSERSLLERAVRRELARRAAGDSAAARVALEGEPLFQRALQLLERSHAPHDVFEVAGLGAPQHGSDGRDPSEARRPHNPSDRSGAEKRSRGSTN